MDAVDSTDDWTVVADSSLAVVGRVVVDSTPVAVVDSMPVVVAQLVVERLVVERLVAAGSSPVAAVDPVVALVQERVVLAVQFDSVAFEPVQWAAGGLLLCLLKRKP